MWPSFSLEVIVVDNASSDDTALLLPSHHPWVQLLTNTRNVGFPAGCNQGYGASRGGIIFFLNPDTELTEESLGHLYGAIADHHDIGVVGPRLCYEDGTTQSSRRRFPELLTGFWESTWLAGGWPQNPWLRRYHLLDRPDDRRQDVDWLVGAALMVRREVLETVGAFDEGFFMYSEELDLCRRVRQAGWRVLYVPEATVIHLEGRSSRQVSAQRYIYFNTSKVRYYHKVYGAPTAELLRHFLLLEYRLQLVVEGLKLLLGHRPALRRSRIQAYRGVLASRLR